MARYRVQGPNGEIIEIEGPDGADPADVIAQAQTLYRAPEKTATDYAKDFGKATASLADTALNAVTGTLDYAAYPLARAFGRTPEQATAETTSPKDVIGRAFGITQDPAYRGEASRRIMGGIGEGVEQYAVKPIASATGLPETDVANMVNTGMLGVTPALNRGVRATAGAVGRGAETVGQAAQTVAGGVADFGRGAMRGMAYPEATSPSTALLPIKPNYYPHEQVAEFMAGRRPATSLTAEPTSGLINQSPLTRWAYGMAPKNAAGERLVPAAGKLMQGIGENIGSGIRTNPIQGLLDIAGLATIQTPVGSAIKAIPAAATTLLQTGTQFEPGFLAARNAALAAEGRAGLQASLPQTPLLPAPGPVRPGPTPTVYVNPQGTATTNVAGTQTNYTPAPVRSTTFNEVRGGGAFGQPSQTPFEAARAAAAARITPASSPTQALSATPQGRAVAAMLEQRRAAEMAALQARAQAAGGYTPPRVDQPTVAPVAPAEMPPAAPAPQTTLDQLRSRLQPQTPEQIAAVEAYNAKTPAEKARQTRAENAAKKAPPGVSNMIVPDEAGKLPTKEQFEKATLFDRLGKKPIDGTYQQGDLIVRERHVPNPQFGDTITRVFKNTKTGEIYAEKYRGGELLDRSIEMPDMQIDQRFATELRDGVPTRTNQITIRQGMNEDIYIDGKFSHSYFDQSAADGPLLGPPPDLDLLATNLKSAGTSNQTPSKKAPPGVISMIPEESTGTLKIGDARYNGGTYDNPLPHTQALDMIENFEALNKLKMVLPEQKVNIVGGTADGAEKYIVRKLPSGNMKYEYVKNKPGTDIELESIDAIIDANNASPSHITWKNPNGYDYIYIGGRLNHVIDNISDPYSAPMLEPTTPGWNKVPKVPVPDVIERIRKIKE